jgi:DNA invertase Pin-like site-specific DNA recombinase
MLTRYVGVARISMEERRKEKRGSKGHSIGTQIEIIKSIGKSLGYTLADDLGVGYRIRATGGESSVRYPGIYYDDGGPGWAMGVRLRPALARLIEDAKERKFGAVIVAYQDRLSRLSEDTKKLYRAFKALGVSLVIEGRIISDQDVLVLGIKAETYEDIVRNIRKKTIDTLQLMKSEGFRLGRPPIGLQRTPDDRAFEISSYGQRIQKLHDEGKSLTEIRAMAGPFIGKDSEPRSLSKSGIARVLRNIKWLKEDSLESNMEKLRAPVLRKLSEYDALHEIDRQEFDIMLNSIPGVQYEFT